MRLAWGWLVCCVVLCWSSAAWAGPWTKGGGEYYVKGSELFFVSGTYVDASGRAVEGTDFLSATSAVYGEVGLLPGLHVQAFLPYVFARNAFEDGSKFLNAGGGDALLGLQWTPPLRLGALRWAVRPELKVPMYDVGGIEGPLAPKFPAFGDGQLDATLWLSLGGSLPSLGMYGFLEAGYRYRSELYVGVGDDRVLVDTFAFFGQLGYDISGVIVAGNVQGALPFVDDAVTRAFIGVGLSLYVPLWGGLGLEAGGDWLPWARNSAPGWGFNLGVSIKG